MAKFGVIHLRAKEWVEEGAPRAEVGGKGSAKTKVYLLSWDELQRNVVDT